MSIFNPYVLLGIVLAVLSAFGGGYWKGSKDEITRQQLEIAKLNAEARQKEQILVSAIQTQATKLQKANQDAKLVQQKRDSDINSGALRLRIPVKTPSCPTLPTASDAPVAERSDPPTAELQPEVARDILAITDEADLTARKLNACIATYNQVREMINQKESK
jgi:type II secretory pathway pseudopilin PulG